MRLFVGLLLAVSFMIASVHAEEAKKSFFNKSSNAQTKNITPGQFGRSVGAPEAVAAVKPGEIRVQLVPKVESLLASQIAGRIIDIPFEEGESFKEGETLIQFDCKIYEAQLRKAVADRNAALTRYNANQELAKLNSGSKVELKISKAESDKAAAEIEIVKTQLSYCSVDAPYDGKVVSVLVSPYESVKDGQELVQIIDDSELELEVIVPSKWISRLSKGKTFKVFIDENAKSYTAKIDKVGARVDPVSQSINVVGTIVGNPSGLKAGMSGRADFEGKE